MRGNKKLLALLCVFVLTLTGCGNNSSTEDNNVENNANDITSNEKIVSTIINEDEMFTDRDFKTDYDTSKSVSVELKGDSVSCESDTLKIKKNTITLSEEGTYIFSGTLNDGMIVVDAEESDKLQIVLDNASITSNTSAALYIIEADKVFVTLAEGSDNTLANGGTFTAIDDNNIDGAIFSKQDLTFNGSGSLTVTSPADHGIVCKDDLVFTGGTYTVNSASHGLDANDSVRMTNASMTIASGKDGIHSNASITVKDGSFAIASGDDAFHADGTLTISGGTIDISESYEGLEALDIKVTGGDIKLVASDDGLNAAGGTDSSGFGGPPGNDQFDGHGMRGPGGGRGGMGAPGGDRDAIGGPGGSSSSNGSIVISGGNLYINASGDGIDANGSLEITGGHTTVVGPTRGDTATLDYDQSAIISGGTFIGTGASGMAQTFSDSKQGVIAVSVGNQAAGTKIELKDSNGNTILTHEPELDFAVVILSSPDIQKNQTYTITVGTSTSSFEAN